MTVQGYDSGGSSGNLDLSRSCGYRCDGPPRRTKGVRKDAVALLNGRNFQEQQCNKVTQKRVTAGECGVCGRAERRHKTRTQHGGTNAFELRLVVRVHEVADRKPAIDIFESP